MRTLLPDPPPPGFEELLAQRRRWDADRRDEVWEGVLHVTPAPSNAHEALVIRLGCLLCPLAVAAGLELVGGVGIGRLGDYRVPDLAVLSPPLPVQWNATAELVIEIRSPGDETPRKLGFYAAHSVGELLIVDPAARAAEWLALSDGAYAPVGHSAVIDLSSVALLQRIDWPA